MAIEVRDGVHYYWPKGDAADEPDGCWVPEAHVTGYVIEMHKDVNPENAELRENVNAAWAALSAAEAALDEAKSVLDEADAHYDDLMERLCGAGVSPSNCVLPTAQYNLATAAYNRYTIAYQEYSAAFDLYKAAFGTWECWQIAAKKSERPGHIPYSC